MLQRAQVQRAQLSAPSSCGARVMVHAPQHGSSFVCESVVGTVAHPFFVAALCRDCSGYLLTSFATCAWDTDVSTCNRGLIHTAFAFDDQVGMCTVYGYSYTGNKGTCSTSFWTPGSLMDVSLIFRFLTINSVEASLIALAQPLVQVAVELDGGFLSMCMLTVSRLAVSCSSAAGRTSTTQFLSTGLGLSAAR